MVARLLVALLSLAGTGCWQLAEITVRAIPPYVAQYQPAPPARRQTYVFRGGLDEPCRPASEGPPCDSSGLACVEHRCVPRDGWLGGPCG